MKKLWLQWLLLTLGAWLLTWPLGRLWNNELINHIPPLMSMLVLAMITFAFGIGIAAVQWLVLRRYVSEIWPWLFANGAGTVIGTAVAMPLKLMDHYVGSNGFQLDELWYGAVFGLVLGAAQWLALRPWLPRSAWWIVGTTVGWTLGMLLGQLLPQAWRTGTTSVLAALITASIPTAITGGILILLLPRISPPAADIKLRTG